MQNRVSTLRGQLVEESFYWRVGEARFGEQGCQVWYRRIGLARAGELAEQRRPQAEELLASAAADPADAPRRSVHTPGEPK